MSRLPAAAIALALLAALATPARADDSVEPIFAAARGYTAYVRTRIALPYIEDEQGAQIGAGVRLGEIHRARPLPAHHLREIQRLLLRGAA